MNLPTLVFFSLLFWASSAMAYIGPGVGLGAIAASLAIILGVIFLFGALVWFPLKRRIKSIRSKENNASDR